MKQNKLARPQDVDDVLEKVFETGYHYFRELWEIRLDAGQRHFLTALVHGQIQDVPDPGLIQSLIYKEIIEKSPAGGYSFQVPLIRKWVTRKTAPGMTRGDDLQSF